ncbi:unnamed protein product [Adineta ricciae]|uniref:Uncharacterized protein n=1 Tax=Adineta ricciae TaxID=249248 RepID=A0A815GGI2_ADIRI|nr:unnamed protein product [Adineta ricciae]CAF1628728.1 unnamed protein product [Adineta ricciae]
MLGSNNSINSIDLPYDIPYFDDFYTEISILANGLFALNSLLTPYQYNDPQPFPLRDNDSIIAGYWYQGYHNQIYNNRTEIYYQIHSNTTNSSSSQKAFAKANEYIQKYLSTQRTFQPKMVITSTWLWIGSAEPNSSNTFQIVLTTDEERSFVFFLYHQLQWANPANSSFYRVQAGVNHERRNVSISLPYTDTDDIVKLVNESNVNVPGLFVYRVDTLDVNASRCAENASTISFRPRFGSQLGSTPLIIYGPCFTDQTQIKCRFEGSHIVTGFVLDQNRALCRTPFVSKHHSGPVEISIDNGQTFLPAGTFLYLPVQFGSNEVTVEVENGQKLPNTGDYVTVKWQFSNRVKNIFPNGAVIDIELLKVRLNSLSQLDIASKSVVLASNLSMMNEHRVRIPEDILTGFIRVVVRLNSNVYAGIHSDLLVMNSSSNSAAESCRKWADQQTDPADWNDGPLLPCPMTTDQVKRAGFCCYEPEAHCYKNSPNSNNCWLHKGRSDRHESSAVECYTSKYANAHGASAQCCYDDKGMIITRGTGAGTDDRYRPTSTPLQHFFHDFVPYLQCCIISTDFETCNMYMTYRPPRRGSNTMGDSGRMWGDPHFGTLDGFSYTFNGYGEYTYLAISNKSSPAADFNANGQSYVFLSQIRTVPIETNGPTVTKAFAARSFDAESKPISLTTDSRHSIILHRDKQVIEWEEDINKIVFPELTIVRENDYQYQFSWNIGVTIVVNIVRITLPSKQFVLNVGAFISGDFSRKTYGLMGTYDGNPDNDLRASNGTIISKNTSIKQIHEDFGKSWAIDPTTSLFIYNSDKTAQWFSDQNRIFTPSFTRPPPNHSSHQVTCGINPTLPETSWSSAQRTCSYDLSITNDTDFAKESLKAGEQFERMQIRSPDYPLFNSSLPLRMDLIANDIVELNLSPLRDNSSNITLSSIHLPSNSTLNTSTGVFRWTTIEGDHYLIVQAHDQQKNLTTKHDIAFHVKPAGRSNTNDFKATKFLFILLMIIHLLR